MKKTILIYGVALAFIAIALKYLESAFVRSELGIELYLGTVAIICAILGSWFGAKWFNKKEIVVQSELPPFELDELKLKELGISRRELEVLVHMADGLSNQEIADILFVSVSTIKTHSSSLFIKLDVKRRTMAVQMAKELRLIK